MTPFTRCRDGDFFVVGLLPRGAATTFSGLGRIRLQRESRLQLWWTPKDMVAGFGSEFDER